MMLGMSTWNRQTPLGGPLNPLVLVTERDFAAHILSRHARVESVDIRDCDPREGHCSLVITGGSPTEVRDALRPLTDVTLHVYTADSAERIIRALAAADPIGYNADCDERECTLCEAWPSGLHDGDHEPDCPWRLAVEWVAENDRDVR